MPVTTKRLWVVSLCAYASLVLAGSIYDVFEPLHVADGKPVWGDLHLGMTVEEVQSVVSERIELVSADYTESIGLVVQQASIRYDDRLLDLIFDAESQGTMRLSQINVPRQRNDDASPWNRTRLLREVKKRLPGLTFMPSHHEPEATESESDQPSYNLTTSPGVVVVLEPGYSITISNEYLFD